MFISLYFRAALLPRLPGFSADLQRSLGLIAVGLRKLDEHTSNLDLGSVWLSLSVANKLFLLYFCGVVVYTLSLCLYVFVSLYSDDSNRAEHSLDKLKRRLANLRQFQLFTLYLFEFCIMGSIPNAFVTFGDSKTWPIGQYIRGISVLFYFDAPIFLGFLVLHTLQWVATVRVACVIRRRG